MAVYLNNTNVLKLTNFRSVIDGSIVSDADVTVTVRDSSGASISGQTWPAAMSPVSGSDGEYRLILNHELPFTAKRSYTAEIIATKDGSQYSELHVIQPVERT